MKKDSKILFIALNLLAVVMLSACGGLISRPEPLQIIVMDSSPKNTPSLCTQTIPVQIVIPAPQTSAGLNSERIAILLHNREVNYMSGYKWDDSNGRLIQRQLIDSINNSRCFGGAGSGSTSLRADYRIEVDLRRLHFVYTKEAKRPSAEVAMSLRLVEVNSGTIISQHNSLTRKECGEDIFAAMEETMQQSMDSSLKWLIKSVQGHRAEKK